MANGSFTNIYATGNIYSNGFISAAGTVIGGSLRSGLHISALGNITGGNLNTAGNISGGQFIGNGSLLTGITSSNAVSAITVTQSSQPNITQVGSLLSLTVVGTTRASNILTSGHVLASGNVVGVNLLTAGRVSALGNVHGNYFIGNGALLTGINSTNAISAGTVTSSAQPNITSVGTLNSLNVFGTTSSYNLVATGTIRANGNITGSYLYGNGYYLTGISAGNSSIAATVTANAQPNITSVGNLTTLTVTGNITGNYIYGNGSQLTGLATGSSRVPVSVSTGALTANAVANVTIAGYKGYALYSIATDAPAWVTVYSSVSAREADSTRPVDVDPTPGSGVIAEIIAASATTQLFTPGVFGFSSEAVPTGNIQLKVVNTSDTQANITVTLTILKMES